MESLTRELGPWAALAGRTITQDRDGAVVADSGGELRIYASRRGSRFLVHEAERSEGRQLQMVAFDIEDVLRALTVWLGSDIRAVRRLPWTGLVLPIMRSDLAAGAVLEVVEDEETAAAGSLVAVVIRGERRAFFRNTADPFYAVAFSHYADHPVDQIRESFLHPAGAPLFGRATLPAQEP